MLRSDFKFCFANIAFVCAVLASIQSGGIPRLEAQGKVGVVNAHVSVGSVARQTFQGFGASLGNWNNDYQKLPEEDRRQLSESLWTDLRFRILRLWMNTNEFRPQPETSDIGRFKEIYVNSELIADAKKYGATVLLLAPDGIPSYMKVQNREKGFDLICGQEVNYAKLIADFIEQLRQDAGITVDATGIQNEPNELDRISAKQLVDVVKFLRIELNSRNLNSTKIIASEQSSGDDVMDQHVDAFRVDSSAWDSLAGIASHSYNMGARDSIAKRIEGNDGRNLKDYWMTEASDNGPEIPGDTKRAASLASRFLSDMNHRVTHWIHFLGFEISDPRDNATRIITFELKPNSITRLTKYYYYRTLSHAFDVGAVFRKCTSSLDGEMTFTFGQKPRLTVAAAKNTDGTWTIGMCNFTADSFEDVVNWGDAKWNREQGGHTPGMPILVDIHIPDLETSEETVFEVHRCNSNGVVFGPAIMAKRGRVIVEVEPLELVTLRTHVKQ